MPRIPYPFVLIVLVASFLVPSPHPSHAQSLHFISDIEWNADGTLLALSRISGEIEIHNGISGALLYERSAYEAFADIRWGLHDLAWHPDGVHLAFNQPEIGIVVFDVQTEEMDAVGEIGGTYGVTRLAWSPDGTILAAIATDGMGQASEQPVLFWEYSANTLDYLTYFPGKNANIAWHPHEPQIAISDLSAASIYYDVETEVYGSLISDGNGGSSHLIWLENGNILSLTEGHIYVWDVMTSTPIHDIIGETYPLDADLSPDGTIIAISSLDIKFWNIETELLVQTLPLTHSAFALAWSPDGSQFAYAEDDVLYVVETSSILPQTDIE